MLGTKARGLTGGELAVQARRGGRHLTEHGARTLIFIGENGLAFPLALFAASAAGIPFLPLNYRLAPEQLAAIVAQAGPAVHHRRQRRSARLRTRQWASSSIAEWTDLVAQPEQALRGDAIDAAEPDPDDEAVLLMTSGTTAAPKSAILRHRHLVSYVLGTVEFGSAAEDDAVIVSVPPYHIAAVANLLTNLYSGRRIVYLERFTAAGWLETVATEGVTHAMVVPTMLARIVDELEASASIARRRRRAPAAVAVLRRRPADARHPPAGAVAAARGRLRERLRSHRDVIVDRGPRPGRPPGGGRQRRPGRAGTARLRRPSRCPGSRSRSGTADGAACAPGQTGQIYVRGAQVAGEYRETGPVTDADGWFSTRDEGYLDADGFLFVRGRADDTIIRGGENIAPAEIEEVILQIPGVADVAVVGLPSEEWGQRIGAFIVPEPGASLTDEQVRAFVQARLRSAKTPDLVVFLGELPHTATGKVLRRNLLALVAADTI